MQELGEGRREGKDDARSTLRYQGAKGSWAGIHKAWHLHVLGMQGLPHSTSTSCLKSPTPQKNNQRAAKKRMSRVPRCTYSPEIACRSRPYRRKVPMVPDILWSSFPKSQELGRGKPRRAAEMQETGPDGRKGEARCNLG